MTNQRKLLILLGISFFITFGSLFVWFMVLVGETFSATGENSASFGFVIIFMFAFDAFVAFRLFRISGSKTSRVLTGAAGTLLTLIVVGALGAVIKTVIHDRQQREAMKATLTKRDVTRLLADCQIREFQKHGNKYQIFYNADSVSIPGYGPKRSISGYTESGFWSGLDYVTESDFEQLHDKIDMVQSKCPVDLAFT